jgi:tetratricopeptide (TPR) repeat protein
MVVVMPEGEMSFFINAYNEPKDRFEDYLIIDLQKYINEKYSIDTSRQSIGGFSLGGYGAMTLALKHPGLFQYVICICGAISGVRDLEETKTRPNIVNLIPDLDRVFGKEPNDYRIAHDPFELYKKTPPEDLPYIFLVNGIYDPNRSLVAAQNEFAELLYDYGAYYEYHEVPGRHSYESTGNAALNLVFQRIAYFKDKKARSFARLLERKIADDGIAEAISRYNLAIKTIEDSPYYIDRNELNQLGYTFINESKAEAAIAVFQLAIEIYPKSANLYDSISDAYIANGDTASAINAVMKCIRLIPDDPYLSDDFAIELKQIAEDKLKLFEGK